MCRWRCSTCAWKNDIGSCLCKVRFGCADPPGCAEICPAFYPPENYPFLRAGALRVLTDEKWLVFVLEQILSNALKYTKSGSIHIYLSPDAPKTLVIEDTGIGIAPEDLPRIFEKGYTGCNGRADKRSTGIGLYLCRQIMEKLSHTIRIESEMGVGTKVYLGLDTVSL